MPADDPHMAHHEAIDEPPPFLGDWGNVYVAVIAYLFILITLFYAFSRAFAP